MPPPASPTLAYVLAGLGGATVVIFIGYLVYDAQNQAANKTVMQDYGDYDESSYEEGGERVLFKTAIKQDKRKNRENLI